MLRESIAIEGGAADLRALTDPEAAAASAIPGAASLVAFVDATLAGDPARIATARDRVRLALGWEALVDAAAVIGNFERMVRIADGIGIPLDAVVNVGTESIRAELGIDAFGSAQRTPPVSVWARTMGRVVQPVVRRLMKRNGRRRGA